LKNKTFRDVFWDTVYVLVTGYYQSRELQLFLRRSTNAFVHGGTQERDINSVNP